MIRWILNAFSYYYLKYKPLEILKNLNFNPKLFYFLIYTLIPQFMLSLINR